MNRFLFIVILFYSSLSFADLAPTQSEIAFLSYKNGEYKTAAAKFEELLTPKSLIKEPSVYYNLGNSYFKLGQYGKAILNYRKTLLIQPNHKNAKHNLSLARKKINKNSIYLQESIILSPLSTFNKSQIRFTFLVTFFFTCILLSIYPKYPYKFLSITSVVLASYLALLTFGTTYSTYGQPVISFSELSPAVIIKDTNAYSSRDKNSQIIALVKNGSELLTDVFKEGWFKVKLQDGKKAWLPSDIIKVVDDS